MSGAILDTEETSVNITDKNQCSYEGYIPVRERRTMNDVNKQHTYQVDNKCQGEKVKKDGENGKGIDILGRLARGGLIQKVISDKKSKGHEELSHSDLSRQNIPAPKDHGC